MAAKIVVEINGGCVQEVYSDDPAVTVVVVDWDTDGSEPGDGNYFVEDDLGNEHLAHTAVFEPTPVELLPIETRAAVDAAESSPD
jgi:hypothetical protein